MKTAAMALEPALEFLVSEGAPRSHSFVFAGHDRDFFRSRPLERDQLGCGWPRFVHAHIFKFPASFIDRPIGRDSELDRTFSSEQQIWFVGMPAFPVILQDWLRHLRLDGNEDGLPLGGKRAPFAEAVTGNRLTGSIIGWLKPHPAQLRGILI